MATMEVSAVSDAVGNGEVLFDWQAKALNTPATNFNKAYVNAIDESVTKSSLESLTSMYPELTVNTHAASMEEASDMFVQRWAIFIFVLIILMAGVLNTLLNNILAKRKEFAVLRTIGVRPMGIVKIIVTQISFYLLLGLVFGTFCGLVFSLIVSLIDSGRVAIDFPLMWGVAASMWFVSMFIFVPVGWVMENKKISTEILSDNK
ncbi:hypothetical protein QWY15_11995 [Planococcus sp. N064]|uniref:ABC3 transporter permease C-terminal domain-containing protein n=2 Tax=Planococcus liqunii TaxID=3058394 RepID=A0ABT8MSY8_9BACL|nr:FtsX-like permease family protein [Planococcus sp. N064]MDN7228020.1 hypothetical protein [Planococcus sp. N064]